MTDLQQASKVLQGAPFHLPASEWELRYCIVDIMACRAEIWLIIRQFLKYQTVGVKTVVQAAE